MVWEHRQTTENEITLSILNMDMQCLVTLIVLRYLPRKLMAGRLVVKSGEMTLEEKKIGDCRRPKLA